MRLLMPYRADFGGNRASSDDARLVYSGRLRTIELSRSAGPALSRLGRSRMMIVLVRVDLNVARSDNAARQQRRQLTGFA